MANLPLTQDARKAVRHMLLAWGHTEALVSRQQARITHLRSLISEAYDSTTRHTMRDVPSRTARGDSPVERAYDRAQTLAASYQESAGRAALRIARALKNQQMIDSAIETLLPLEQNILHLRYRRRHSWQSVACNLGYHISYVKKCEQQALDRIAECIRAR